MVADFWDIDQSKLTPEQIFELIKNEYGEDFIENYSMWKDLIAATNEEVKSIMKDVELSTEHFEEMTFDQFCKDIINLLEQCIKLRKEIVHNDIPDIIFNLRNALYMKNYQIAIKHKNSVTSLKESIKKVIAT